MVHNMLGVSWLFCPWNLMRWIWEMQRVQGSCLGNKQLYQSPWLYHSHLPKPAFSSRPDPLILVTDYCTVYWIGDCSIILEAKMILSLCSWLSPPYEETDKLVNDCCKEHDICKFKNHIGSEIAYKRTFIKKQSPKNIWFYSKSWISYCICNINHSGSIYMESIIAESTVSAYIFLVHLNILL